MSPWKIWIDTGGTFTDCLAINPTGEWLRLKVLSNGALRGHVVEAISPTRLQVSIHWPASVDIYKGYRVRWIDSNAARLIVSVDTSRGTLQLDKPIGKREARGTIEISTGEEVPVFAARLLTHTEVHQPFPPIEMKLGSTRGTNAILERKGARTALLVTKGFRDLLVIGNQQREDLFSLPVHREMPLYDAVLEVTERLDAQGRVVIPLDSEELERIARQLKRKRIESIAVAFLNSYRNSAHEAKVKQLLTDRGFQFVSASHELSAQIRILPRAETTVANAYLEPIIDTYLHNIQKGLSGALLKVMSSAGSLIDIKGYLPKDSLLSGPAGGVVGAATSARHSGVDKIITFDMGGTSTDVSLYNQRFDYRFESQVGKLRILSPSLSIETIAAGGGSICDFDGFKFTVGPASAGAFPGPACYGAGGPLTITDVNLLSGRIDTQLFAIPLSKEKSERALDSIIQRVKRSTGRSLTKAQALTSFLEIANEKMAEAIRKVSTQVGHNPQDFTLLSFGGAGGQHACELANKLSMKSVLIPYNAGLLSAYGIGNARVERFKEKLILEEANSYWEHLPKLVSDLYEQGRLDLTNEGYEDRAISRDKILGFFRFKGQETSLEIDLTKTGLNWQSALSLFQKTYEALFGHWLPHRAIELEAVRVVAVYENKPTESKLSSPKKYRPRPLRASGKYKVYRWESIRPGASITGPALVVSDNSTTVVDRDWSFYLDEHNNGILRANKRRVRQGRPVEEAELELFTNRFTAFALEMGALLQRTSFSVNVKERLDFSCALLDKDGYLVVNAPHIPVHLGSLGVCVGEVMKVIDMRPGDIIITNHPAFGGSHLPDITLIKPVYVGKSRIGFVANRAHHAEIGGRKPGSMPADATTLEEEGVIIPPTHLARNNRVDWKTVENLFTKAAFPTRSWDENRADLNGAIAAVNFGERAFTELCQLQGIRKVQKYMVKMREQAAHLLAGAVLHLPRKKMEAIELLDDGSPLRVQIERKGTKLRIDFSGSSSQHRGNLNATKAIVQSVVLYVLRVMVNRPMPMNEGLMDQIDLVLPHGLLNPDFSVPPPPAVVGGNTEISQRLTDTLLKAFGLAACSQGTMNNFLFGNEHFGYYETICGGTGAGNGFAGTSGVHHHMTNTRITDPEILEWRYPVRLERFELRKNSGGSGRWRGGDGIVRELSFLERLDINILSQHRQARPFGLEGGLAGKTGHQRIVRGDGTIEELGGMDSRTVERGDRIIIETPGGGGFGKPTKS